jgi:hypothetical protein
LNVFFYIISIEKFAAFIIYISLYPSPIAKTLGLFGKFLRTIKTNSAFCEGDILYAINLFIIAAIKVKWLFLIIIFFLLYLDAKIYFQKLIDLPF